MYQYDRAVVPATLYWQLKLGKSEQLLEVASIDNFLIIVRADGMNKFSFLILVSSKAFGKCELTADASTDNFFFFFLFLFFSFWKVQAAGIDNFSFFSFLFLLKLLESVS